VLRSLRCSPLWLVALAACSERPIPPVEDASLRDASGDRVFEDRRSPAVTSPYPAAEYTVTLPYQGPEQRFDLEFTASPARVDVHLLVDTTGSFDGEIRELQQALSNVTLPALQARIPSLTLGVSRFEDMPWEPFGLSSDRPYTLVIPQTTVFSAVDRALFRLDDPLGAGGDIPEAWYEALFQVATGQGLSLGSFGAVPPFAGSAIGGGTLGGVGFRRDATRVVVLVTDAPSHEGSEYRAVVPQAHSSEQAIAALNALDVRVVGIASGNAARSALEAVATRTNAVAVNAGAFCATGLNGALRPSNAGNCPLVYDIAQDGTGLSRTVADGIGAVLDTIAFNEIHGEARDDSASFVRAIEAVSASPPANSAAPGLADRRPAAMPDGLVDTFTSVRSRTVVRFRAHLANRSVREGLYPQVFFLRVALVGDGADIREALVRVIVPEGPKFDAGGDPDASEAGVVNDAEAETDASTPDAAPEAAVTDADEPTDAGDQG
jgi:hypothetical protein